MAIALNRLTLCVNMVAVKAQAGCCSSVSDAQQAVSRYIDHAQQAKPSQGTRPPASADSCAAAAAQLRVGNKLPVVWSGHDGPADEAEAAPGSREASSQAATSEADDLELPGFTLVDSIVAAIEVALPHLPGGCWGCSKAFRAACELELGLGARDGVLSCCRAMLVDSSVAAIEGTSCSVGCWQLCWAFDSSAWR